MNWKTAIIHYRTPGLLATLACVLLLALGLKDLRVEGEYRIFFSRANPELQAFETMQATYAKSDNALIIITPKTGDVFAERILNLIRDLTDQSWGVPFASRVDSITNFQHLDVDGDTLGVQNLYDPGAAARPGDRVREVALAEPFLLGKLVNGTGAVTAINITFDLPGLDKRSESQRATQAVGELLASYRQHYPDVEFRLSGIVPIGNAFADEAQNDAKSLTPLMYIILLALIMVLFRRIGLTVAVLLLIALSIVGALGAAGWLGYSINTVTLNAPTIIMTVAVADAIHLISTALREHFKGRKVAEAVDNSLLINSKAVIITSLTTAVGFLTLSFSDSPPIQALGVIVAIGVTLALVLSLFLLPACITRMSLPKTNWRVRVLSFGAYVGFLHRHHNLLLVAGLGIVVLLTGFAFLNKVNDDPLKYFQKELVIRQDTDYLAEHLAGAAFMEFSLDTGRENGVTEPEFLEVLEAFKQWLLSQPNVDHVIIMSDILKRLNKNMHGDADAWYRLPDSRELAAQYLLLYELSLPPGLELTTFMNLDKSATRIIVTCRNIGSHELLDLERRSKQWLALHTSGVDYVAASPRLMFAHIGDRNVKSLLAGLLTGLVLISLLMAVALRSIRIGLLSLLPNLLPVLAGLGVWGLLVGEINLVVSIVAGVAMGIIVDDTVHFLSHFQDGLTQGLDVHGAVTHALEHVGGAIIATTLLLGVGFSVLAQSQFNVNAQMGLLTTLVIVLALIFDLVFLPALLFFLARRRTRWVRAMA